MRGYRIAHQSRRTDHVLNGIQQRQTGKNPDGQLLLLFIQRLPGRQVVGERHFLRQPEVAGEAVPDLKIFLILKTVPVNGLNLFKLHSVYHREQETQP